MYKMQCDGYTLLYYPAQLKLTLWKSPHGEHIYMMSEKKKGTMYTSKLLQRCSNGVISLLHLLSNVITGEAKAWQDQNLIKNI